MPSLTHKTDHRFAAMADAGARVPFRARSPRNLFPRIARDWAFHVSPNPQSEIRHPESIHVLGMPITPFDADGLIDTIIARARRGVRTLGCYANAHTANLALADQQYHRILSKCDILLADGNSIVWAARLAGLGLSCRLTAMDYFPLLAERCATEGLSLFLLGGRPGIAAKAAECLTKRFLALRIVGTHSGHIANLDVTRVIEAINTGKPDILIVGMRSPRQETWLTDHADEIRAPVRWCVGALFDYLAGRERRAPNWLCQMSGEWLFRLAMDPMGKWRRYLLGNPLFVWNTIRWLTNRRQGRLNGERVSASTARGCTAWGECT